MEVTVSASSLVRRAADAAVFQKQHGDARSLRLLFRSTFSLLRYIHRHWEVVG